MSTHMQSGEAPELWSYNRGSECGTRRVLLTWSVYACCACQQGLWMCHRCILHQQQLRQLLLSRRELRNGQSTNTLYHK